MENKPVERIKVCPSCGETFSCFSDNCWCSKLPNIIPLTPESQCMCPKCLGKTIDEKIEKAEPEQKKLLLQMRNDK